MKPIQPISAGPSDSKGNDGKGDYKNNNKNPSKGNGKYDDKGKEKNDDSETKWGISQLEKPSSGWEQYQFSLTFFQCWKR